MQAKRGDTVRVHWERIAAENAYGERRDEMIFTVGREQMPEGAEVNAGDMLRVGFADGSSTAVQVAALDEASVTLDAGDQSQSRKVAKSRRKAPASRRTPQSFLATLRL